MAMQTEQPGHLIYRGKSMWPCFQDDDLLELTPLAVDLLQSGDCISFFSDGGATIVTHRICSLRGGLHTRGDAHPDKDDYLVEPDLVIGKVVGCNRLGRHRTISGGWRGRLLAVFYHYAGRVDPERASRGGSLARNIRALLQWPAKPLYRRGGTKSFPSEDGKLTEYWLINGRALCSRKGLNWHIPWPWSLLLDESKLPKV